MKKILKNALYILLCVVLLLIINLICYFINGRILMTTTNLILGFGIYVIYNKIKYKL